ncbi:autophagy-related protein 27 [Crassisporium funariophilum]|nr:autophagy-related protein 27 [Crassisporium funariophilum]
MIIRCLCYEILLAFLCLSYTPAVSAQADTSFDCHVTVDNTTKFDLTSLAGEHIVNRTRETPPSTMIDSLRFDLCADLKALDGLSEHDQCPTGTRACLTKENKKSEQENRITAVIPIAQTSKLDATYSYSLTPKSLSLLLHGSDYPSPTTTIPSPQSLNVTITCTPDGTSGPTFIAYDGSRLDLQWNSPAGCPFQEDGDHKGDHKDDDKEEDDKPQGESVGSGIGWFFLLILLAFAAYLGLGAYYNYSTYGARGSDLIPHRDFWKEVPYMLSDVVSHLCSNVRPRRNSSRGGYMSV